MRNPRVADTIAVAAASFALLSIAGSGFAQAPRQQAWSILQSGVANIATERRVAAVTVLAMIQGDPKAVTMAEQALQDPDPQVRKAAAVTLGTLKAKSAIPKLHNALNDKDGDVVMAAAKSLVEIGSEYGYGVYYALVTGERKSGEGLIGSQEQQMQQIMHNPKQMADMAFEQGIGYVPFGGIGWGAFQAVHKNEEKEVLVKANAVRTLAKDPDPRSAKAIVNAAGDPQWLVRAASYDALARRGDPSLLPDVAKGLTDQQYVAQLTAAAAVAQLSTVTKK